MMKSDLRKSFSKGTKIATSIRTQFLVVIAVFGLAGWIIAQDEPPQRITINAGAGYTPIVGEIGNSLNNGWNVSFGAGYNLSQRFSLGGQVMYNGVGVNRRVLDETAVPDGNAHIWAFTVEPRINFAPQRRLDPYIVGGVGYYRRVTQFTQPTVTSVVIFDPFFGFVPVQVQANQALGTFIDDGIGGNAGLGFTMGLRQSRAKIYAEARYHYASTGSLPLRMVPVTVGIRW